MTALSRVTLASAGLSCLKLNIANSAAMTAVICGLYIYSTLFIINVVNSVFTLDVMVKYTKLN